jgi:4-hydroxy-tetrahydrodipicolinate synthase
MFTGLSAFPLTPFKDEGIDFVAYENLINNLVNARVNSICTMGSTGLYPYLTTNELQLIARRTVELANGIPVMTGIGALRTHNVLKNAEAAQQAGISAVLLAPVSYHPLKESEVFSLYESVTAELSVPLCVYNNPNTTQFTFSETLYQEVCDLPNIAAIKIPGSPFGGENGTEYLAHLRKRLPEKIAIGVSGDPFGVAGMLAGCDLWLSVLGGLFPNTVKRLIRMTQGDNTKAALKSSEKLATLWALFARNKGGIRVMATAACILGYTEGDCLPKPLSLLEGDDRQTLANLLDEHSLD